MGVERRVEGLGEEIDRHSTLHTHTWPRNTGRRGSVEVNAYGHSTERGIGRMMRRRSGRVRAEIRLVREKTVRYAVRQTFALRSRPEEEVVLGAWAWLVIYVCKVLCLSTLPAFLPLLSIIVAFGYQRALARPGLTGADLTTTGQ